MFEIRDLGFCMGIWRGMGWVSKGNEMSLREY